MSEVDYALHQKVQQVSNLVVRLSEQVGSVSGQVQAVEANQQQTRTELQQLRDEKSGDYDHHVRVADARVRGTFFSGQLEKSRFFLQGGVVLQEDSERLAHGLDGIAALRLVDALQHQRTDGGVV